MDIELPNILSREEDMFKQRDILLAAKRKGMGSNSNINENSDSKYDKRNS